MKNNVKSLSLCLGLASLAFGQTTTAPIYNMSVLAGIPTPNALGDNGPSTTGIVTAPSGIAVDPNGNIFISDNTNSRIRRIDATTGVITTFAQSGVSSPVGLNFDSKGNLIVAQTGNNGQILRIPTTGTTAGTVTVLAGSQNVTGTYGGDGQYAYNSFMNSPAAVALDSNDNIYIADSGNNRVRLIRNTNNCLYTPVTSGNNQLSNSCIIVTIAGNGNTITPQVGTSCGTSGPSQSPQLSCAPVGTNTVGDGGLAIQARINGPYGVAVTPDGSTLYVSQNGDNRIRVINLKTGIINSLIGNCLNGSLVVTCASGSYGNSTSGNSSADGKPSVQGTVNSPRGLYLDSANNILYFADGGAGRIRAINLSTGIVNTVVGGGSTAGDFGSGANSGLLTSISLNTPYGVWLQGGVMYFVEQGANKVRLADLAGQFVRTLVSTPKSTGTGGPATSANLGFASSLSTTASPRVAVDASGNVYAIEASTHQIRQITPDGVIHAWAGTGTSGSLGDGGPALAARLNAPQSMAFDAQGNAYIADTGNNKIRKVDTNGVITTVVGRSQITTCSVAATAAGTCSLDKSNYVGDGGSPLNAVLSGPQGVTVDPLGNLVIADSGHNAIRYVDLTANTIKTIAGGVPAGIPSGPTDGRSGLGSSGYEDGTNALFALFNNPRGIAADSLGNFYIADYGNSAARELSPAGLGTYSSITFYGSGSSSGTGPSIPTGTGLASIPARIRMSNNNATSVAVDSGNNIYYALAADNRVVVVIADHNKIYQVAGGGSNDSGPTITGTSNSTEVPAVTGVAVDSKGTVYTADRTGLIRKLVCTANCPALK